MKNLTIILLLSLSMNAFSQEKETVIYGQEISQVLLDSSNQLFSLVEDNGYNVYGISIGDTIYHNNVVIVDDQGYPEDLNYKFRKVDNRYEIVAILN